MKILITGKNGYIANALNQWIQQTQADFCDVDVEMVSVRDKLPDDLSHYDIIVHTAAIVHKNEKKRSVEQYYAVNEALTIHLAEQAKAQGVRHFIFISTMAVFGVKDKMGVPVVIGKKTPCHPITHYAKSKRAAEIGLLALESDCFTVSIVRPPMVYGPNCPGNYVKLQALAGILPVFPFVENQRSILHIDNLSRFIWDRIERREGGFFHPQDKEYANTSLLVANMAKQQGKRVKLSKIMGRMVTLFRFPIVNKVFGNLVYDKEIDWR